ncbi:MAG: histidine phosphatase family protein [Marinilabiliales bacterium]|nr:MAG: histidine phosphatase family protein [Marinilabiliales bacterium]
MLFMNKASKSVIIMRHAKSSWEDSSAGDHERGLMDKGIMRTKKVAEFMIVNNINPQLILSSTAKRAVETAKIIADSISYEREKIVLSKKLYLSYTDDVFDELFEVDNNINSVMVFGHNPCFTDLVNMFLKKQIDNLPTSGMAVIEFKTDKWKEIPNSKFSVKHLIFPSKLD